MNGETNSDIEVRALREKVAFLEDQLKRTQQELQHARAQQSGCKRKKTEGEVKEEVELPTGVWVKIAEKIDRNDVFAFAMTCKQLREAQQVAGRKLQTRAVIKDWDDFNTDVEIEDIEASFFSEEWCHWWSKLLLIYETRQEIIHQILLVASRHGYLSILRLWDAQPKDRRPYHFVRELWNSSGSCIDMHKFVCFPEDCVLLAARGGHIETLEFLVTRAQPVWLDFYWGADIFSRSIKYAAREGQLDAIKWLRNKGADWGYCGEDDSIVEGAAKGGHLRTLEYLLRERAPFYGELLLNFRDGAAMASLSIVKLLVRYGAVPTEETCLLAAKKGKLNILSWLRSHLNTPWNKSECIAAAREHQNQDILDMIEYIE